MGDTYLISGLTAKRAEVSGIIADFEKRIAQHRADIVHIDTVLRLCAPCRPQRDRTQAGQHLIDQRPEHP